MKDAKIGVLLVEDHTVVREGIRDLIQGQDDMEVIGETGSGTEAVEMAKKLKPHIILMDIALPGLNGIQATRQIKESQPSVSVLVLTAYDNEEFVFAILEAGAAGYLLKNVRGKELLSAIRSVYEGESVLHPAITNKVLGRLHQERTSVDISKGVLLSRRELEVVKLGVLGLVNKEIAHKLSLGERTIQTHWRNIFNKLGVSSRIEAIMYCLRKGWILMEDEKGTRYGEKIPQNPA